MRTFKFETGGLMNPKLSIIIPTYNEEENIEKLLNLLFENLDNYDYEIIVVDDGSDKTKEKATELGAIVIKGQQLGLGQAIVDGIKLAHNPIIIVMDADISHHPRYLYKLVEPIICDGYDMVIGSRYVKGGGIVGWEKSRQIISRIACMIALPITTIKDSTSGFFAFTKDLIDGVELKGQSWKVMLEILVKAKPIKVKEVPIQFTVREKGKSKFNGTQVVNYIKHIYSLALYKYNRFIKFCVVGGIGSIETFGLTWLLTEKYDVWYMLSLVIAVGFATVSNFTLNSIWTFSIGKNMNDADYEWSAYYKGNWMQKWWKEQIIKKVKELLPDEEKIKNKYILDIGCGSSPIASEINAEAGHYIGIDDNWKKIRFIQRKLQKYTYAHCNVNTSDFYNAIKIYGDNDIVMAIEVIEHMRDVKDSVKFIEKLRDSVKEGGEIIIATPNYDSWKWRMIEKIYGWLMPSAYANDHTMKFNEKELIRICGEKGLKHEETRMVCGDCDMVCRFRKVTSSA